MSKELKQLEESIIGAVMLEPHCIRDVIDDLKPKCFENHNLRLIYEVLVDMYKKSKQIDILTVTQELKNRGLLETIGGIYMVSHYTSRVVSTVHIQSWARAVIQEYLKRFALVVSDMLIKNSTEPHCDPLELYERAVKMLQGATSEVTNSKGFKTITSIGDDYVQNLVDVLHGKIQLCLPTFNPRIAEYGLYHKADFTVIGARPGMGKTAFLLSEARHQSFINNIPVGVFSLEMSAEQLLNRIVSAECQINGRDISNGKLNNYQVGSINEKLVQLAKHNLYIDDTARLDIDVLCSRARRMVYEHGVKHIFIDYLGLITTKEYRGDKVNSSGYISNRLKALAKELEIPVTTLSQLSREIEKRPVEQRMPQLSDLRNTGDIEQDADVVMFLFRPEYYGLTSINLDGSQPIDVVDKGFVDVAKNRHGKLGTELIRYVAPYTTFE